MYSDINYDYNVDYDFLSGFLGAFAIVLLVFSLIALIVCLIQIIGQWKVYKKAGKGGWEAIVPFYCNWVLVEIAGLKWYWFLFFFAPLLSGFINLEWLGWIAYLFGMFNIFYNISKRFGKGTGFAVCLTLFTPICMAILGFSKKNVYDANIPVSPNGLFGKAESNTNQNNVQETVQEPATQTFNNQQVSPKFCTECGSALESNAKFCTNCGKEI